MQINNVMKAFPGTELARKDASRQEYKVPIKLNVSKQPLYIKVILGQGFPSICAQVVVMARVTHSYVESGTYNYRGPALANWN